MSNPSPICTVNGAAPPADVTAGSTVNIALAVTAGANYWTIACIGCDEQNTVSALNATITINSGAKTATITAPAALGSAFIVRSTVGIIGLGLDANGIQQPALVTTFKVNVKATNGLRVMALNETTEQSSISGWGSIVNAAARGAAGGGGSPVDGQYNTTLANGLNSNVATTALAYVTVGGPTAAFSVGGFNASPSPSGGQRLRLKNTTAFAMSVVHQDSSSTAANRIDAGAQGFTGTSVSIPAGSICDFVYNGSTSRWDYQQTSVQAYKFSQLTTLSPAAGSQIVHLDGRTTQGDGGQGPWLWNSTDTRAADGGTIVAVTGIATGRWNLSYSGAVSAAWFGMKSDSTGSLGTDNTAAATNFITAINALHARGYVPASPPGTSYGFAVSGAGVSPLPKVTTASAFVSDDGAYATWTFFGTDGDCLAFRGGSCNIVSGQYVVNNFTGTMTRVSAAIRITNVENGQFSQLAGVAGAVNGNDVMLESAYTQFTITGASNTSPIVYTTSAAHDFQTGETLSVGAGGAIGAITGNTAANVVGAVCTVIDSTHFSLAGTAGNGTYGSGGAVARTQDSYLLQHIGTWYNNFDGILCDYLTVGAGIGTGLNLYAPTSTGILNPVGATPGTYYGSVNHNTFNGMDIEGQQYDINLLGANENKFSGGTLLGGVHQIYGRASSGNDFQRLHLNQWSAAAASSSGQADALNFDSTCRSNAFRGLSFFNVQSYAVTGTTGNGVSPMQITITKHNFVTGEPVRVAAIGGNTAANGTSLACTVIDNNTISIPVTGNGTFTSGGTVTAVYWRLGPDLTIANTMGLVPYWDCASDGIAERGVIGRAETYSGNLQDVRWFGGTGDGSTDNSSAISRSIAACVALGGGIVFFPRSQTSYLASQTTSLPSNVILRGDGIGASVLQYTGGGDAVICNASSTNLSYAGIEEMTIWASSTTCLSALHLAASSAGSVQHFHARKVNFIADGTTTAAHAANQATSAAILITGPASGGNFVYWPTFHHVICSSNVGPQALQTTGAGANFGNSAIRTQGPNGALFLTWIGGRTQGFLRHWDHQQGAMSNGRVYGCECDVNSQGDGNGLYVNLQTATSTANSYYGMHFEPGVGTADHAISFNDGLAAQNVVEDASHNSFAYVVGNPVTGSNSTFGFAQVAGTDSNNDAFPKTFPLLLQDVIYEKIATNGTGIGCGYGQSPSLRATAAGVTCSKPVTITDSTGLILTVGNIQCTAGNYLRSDGAGAALALGAGTNRYIATTHEIQDSTGAHTMFQLSYGSVASLALPFGGFSGVPLAYALSTIAVTGGTVTLSAAQLSTPNLSFTGTLTSNLTVAFGGIVGDFDLDFSGVTIGAFTITLTNGAGSKLLTTLLAAKGAGSLISASCRTTATVNAG